MPIELVKGFGVSPEKSFECTSVISQRNAFTLWRRRKVEEVTGLKRSTMYSLIKKGLFPAPVKIGVRSVAWRDYEVMSWNDARSADSFEVC